MWGSINQPLLSNEDWIPNRVRGPSCAWYTTEVDVFGFLGVGFVVAAKSAGAQGKLCHIMISDLEAEADQTLSEIIDHRLHASGLNSGSATGNVSVSQAGKIVDRARDIPPQALLSGHLKTQIDP